MPNRPTGPKDIPAKINADSHSTPNEYFSLFWDDVLWQLLVTETNRQAANVNAATLDNYVAKSWTDTTVCEMKAFFGCRISIEMLIHKDRYEQYWRARQLSHSDSGVR